MYVVLAPPLRQPWMSIGLIGSLDQVFNCAIIILCHHLSPGGARGALAIEYPPNLWNNLRYETERLVWQGECRGARDIFSCEDPPFFSPFFFFFQGNLAFPVRIREGESKLCVVFGFIIHGVWRMHRTENTMFRPDVHADEWNSKAGNKAEDQKKTWRSMYQTWKSRGVQAPSRATKIRSSKTGRSLELQSFHFCH